MDTLYKVQFACFIYMLMCSMLIGLTRLHIKWVNKKYENSRWMLFVAMFIMTLHFFFQMHWGIRASDTEMGAVFNILFYLPSFMLMAAGVYNLTVMGRRKLWRFLSGNIVLYAIILVLCAVSALIYGISNMDRWLNAMAVLFEFSVIHSVANVMNVVSKHKKMLEKETAGDMLPYQRYATSSLAVLYLSALIIPGLILSNTMVMIVGPMLLIALFFYIVTFISLGYNYVPAKDFIVSEENGQNSEEAAMSPGQQKRSTLTDERMSEIQARLDEWCAQLGFKDSSVNMQTLSHDIKVPKSDLSTFFDQGMQCTFRGWLSDIRFKAAQTMMMENPDYSNDIISSECGFSSRSYLYRIFKERVGVTPVEWRDAQIKSSVGE